MTPGKYFFTPQSTTQKRYEVLRQYFYEGNTAARVASELFTSRKKRNLLLVLEKLGINDLKYPSLGGKTLLFEAASYS